MNFVSYSASTNMLEAKIRMLYSKLLTDKDYRKLGACHTLDEFREVLSATKYGHLIQSMDQPTPNDFRATCYALLKQQFDSIYLDAHSVLRRILTFVKHKYALDSAIQLLEAKEQGSKIAEETHRCSPLGFFDELRVIEKSENLCEAYRICISETFLAHYFKNVDVSDGMTNTKDVLYKTYYDDFYDFCAENCSGLLFYLCYDSDKRFLPSLYSILEDKKRPKIEKIGSRATLLTMQEVAEIEDEKALISYLKKNIFYKDYIETESTLEKTLSEMDGSVYQKSLLTQYDYSVFYTYFILADKEVRNIAWIADSIYYNRAQKIRYEELQ